MSNCKSNLPNAVKPTTKPGEISSMVKGYETLWELPPVRKGEVELAKQRIAEYFQFCQSADRKPSVEGLALALGLPGRIYGYGSKLVMRWEKLWHVPKL